MKTDWSKIKGYVKSEFSPPFGKVDAGHEWDMCPELIEAMVEIRDEIKRLYGDAKVIVHYNGGYAVDGHSKRSLHYKGRACDFHALVPDPESKVPNHFRRLSAVELALIVYNKTTERFGIGIYSWGVHLDYRYGVDGVKPAVWYEKAQGDYVFMQPLKFTVCLLEAIKAHPEILESGPRV